MSECVFATRLPSEGGARHAVLCCRRGSNVARGYVATAHSSVGSAVTLPSPFACAAPFAPAPPAAAFFAVGGVAGDLSVVTVVARAPAALLTHTRVHTASTARRALAPRPPP